MWWTSSMCCMLPDGTTIATSQRAFIFPPPIPMSPTVVIPSR